ncbi:MAG: hypothetical protein AAF613_01715, partial [Pseudomonadota bacterium]
QPCSASALNIMGAAGTSVYALDDLKKRGARLGGATVQTAFNTWQDQSGRSLNEISPTLAFSIG